ncbi:MAG: MFS transporter [Caldilineaceae bacterium]|nr:MFS transporter [Caldilineaceae bacterium]
MLIQPVSTAIQRRLTFVLFLAQSIIGAGQILSFTFLPIAAAVLTGNASLAGVPATLTMLGRALAAYPIGWLMDKVGRRFGLALGYFISVVGALLCVAAINQNAFLLLCLGAAVTGVSRSAGEQARFAAAEIMPPERRAKAIGWIVFAGTVGSLATPFITEPAGTMAATVGLLADTGPYLMAAILSLLAGLIIFAFLRPDPKQIGMAIAQATGGQHLSGHARSLREIFATPAVIVATIVLVVSQLVMTLIMVITPLHMHDFHHPNSNITLALTVHTFGMFGFSSVTGWLIDRTSRHLMIVVGAIVLALSALITPLSPALFPVALALFLLGLGWNFCFIAGSSLLSDALAPSERGRAQGANEMVVALAAGTGSLSSGTVFAQGGILTVSMMGLVVSLALAVVAIWAMHREKSVTVAG